MRRIGSRILLFSLFTMFLGCDVRNESSQANREEDDSLARVKKEGVLRWGADVIGGVPYVYEDPNNPGTYIGFEMHVAGAIARELGVNQVLVIRAWDTLIPELQKGSFDMAMNGIEDTEERGKMVLFSEPYYVYSQQLTVRKGTDGVKNLSDLAGRRVATLSGTAAEDLLRATTGIEVVTNPEIIYSYGNLEKGQVDAVLLDTPIAAAYGATNPKLKNVGESFSEGHYVIAFRTKDKALMDAVNTALSNLKKSGELKAIYQKYGIMDLHQAQIGIR